MGTNQTPSAVPAKAEKTKAERKVLWDLWIIGFLIKRCLHLRFRMTNRVPKKGRRVSEAQNANRSYVSHSQFSPKRKRGSEVVPPRPRTKRTTKEKVSPRKRGGHFRKIKGMIPISGPYIGQKKTADAY